VTQEVMDLQTLFGEFPLSRFIADHMHRLPFAIASSARCVQELGNWDLLSDLVNADPAAAIIIRNGCRYDGPAPTTISDLMDLSGKGYTLYIRHAERLHHQLADLASVFEATFLGPVDIQAFATPSGSRGFPWHYDAEDVFILQTTGAKEYSLRKNTVNPWPLEETLPADMRYERELMPLMRVLLRAGDMLYIPSGYWHKAEALETGEAAISLAVGVMSRSAIDVYEFLRSRLVQSLVWRQRLPLLSSPEPEARMQLEETFHHLLRQLQDDLARTLADPGLVKDFLDHFAGRPDLRDDSASNPTTAAIVITAADGSGTASGVTLPTPAP